MGRPIKSKFFGNRASPYDNAQTGGVTGVGGEGIATIVKNNTGTLYTTSTTIVGTMSAPQIKGGVAATVSLTTNAVGNIATVTLLTAGTGYTSAPTALASPTTTGTSASFTVTLFASTVTQNALAFTSYLTTGSNAVAGGDILKQQSSRRYLVQNSEGRGQVRLTATATSTLLPGTMSIVATDGGGATYWVTKLTSRKATLINRTSTSTALITTSTVTIEGNTYGGGTAGWTLGAATGTNQVTLASN
jgi:hypothetical protein